MDKMTLDEWLAWQRSQLDAFEAAEKRRLNADTSRKERRPATEWNILVAYFAALGD